MFNSLSFNPAYAGSTDFMSATALYRDQWLGFEGAPVTQTFSIQSPISDRVSLGFSVINDEIGSTGSTSGKLSYAYNVDIGGGRLSLGLEGSVRNFRRNFDDLNYKHPQVDDFIFNDASFKEWQPNFGAGLYYSNDYFYMGLSVPHLLNYELRETSEGDELSTIISQWSNHYYVHGGAAIPLNGEVLVFRPSFLIKSVNIFSSYSSQSNISTPAGSPTEIDIDLSLYFYELVWAGISFRTAVEKIFENKSSYDSIDFWFNLTFQNGLRIGAAYDYSISKIRNYNSGSIEFMLGYDLYFNKKKALTPRYF